MAPSASRTQAIEHAARLFQRQGYAATGVAQIIEESKTPKGSFYYNFPGGKEEIAREALALSGGRLAAAIDELAAQADRPDAFVRSLVGVLAVGLERSEFTLGCPVATVALETAAISAPLREEAQEQFARWREAIVRGLHGTASHDPGLDVGAQALMLIEGALLMCRVGQSTAPLEHLEAGLQRLARMDQDVPPGPSDAVSRARGPRA